MPTWLMQIIAPAGLSWGKNPADWKANLHPTTRGYRLKVQALCEDCNGINWLGSVEKRAKPKLKAWMAGIYSSLTYEDQKLLSFWAVKTAMTVQIAHPAVKRVIPMAQYGELHKARNHPPLGFYVWIQTLPQRSHHVSFGTRRVFDVPPHGPGYEIDIAIRHLYFRIVGSHVAGRDQVAKAIGEIEGFGPNMEQIWPATFRLLISSS